MTNAPVLFVLGSLIYARAANECIAPILPGPSGCGDCTGKELQSGSCVRGEGNSQRWLSCYSTIEDCCNDGEVKNVLSFESCVAGYNKKTVCDQYVSRDSSKLNRECQTECEAVEQTGKKPEDDEALQAKCMKQHYHFENGRVIPDPECFNGWVHGYSEDDTLSGYKVVEGVETPALCQALCQEDDDCVRFLWANDSAAASNYDAGKRCSLKNTKQVEVPASIIYRHGAQNPPEYDSQYCNYGMAYQCTSKRYQCAPCEGGDYHCIWHSDKHVAGWKFCPDSDQCIVPAIATTLAPTTQAPTTQAPTAKPTTKAPTTKASTTTPATTEVPTTEAPTTKAPTTKAPTTEAPTTKAPTTKAPTTKAPTTKAPTTKAPTTKASTTKALTTKAPTTKTPTTETPTTTAPTTKAPTTTSLTTENPTPITTETTVVTTDEISTVSRRTSNETQPPKPTILTTTETTTAEPTTSQSAVTDVPVKTLTRPHPRPQPFPWTTTILPPPTESLPDCTTTAECDTETTGECKPVVTTKECRPPKPATPECGNPDCEGKGCDNDCSDKHGIALRIHDRPKKIRVAIDN